MTEALSIILTIVRLSLILIPLDITSINCYHLKVLYLLYNKIFNHQLVVHELFKVHAFSINPLRVLFCEDIGHFKKIKVEQYFSLPSLKMCSLKLKWFVAILDILIIFLNDRLHLWISLKLLGELQITMEIGANIMKQRHKQISYTTNVSLSLRRFKLSIVNIVFLYINPSATYILWHIPSKIQQPNWNVI